MKRFDRVTAPGPLLVQQPTGAHADDEEEAPVEEALPALDLVFCIDVSGSMGPYQRILKPTILALIRHAVRLNPGRKLRLGLVRYGDGDRRYLVHDLSEDQDRFLRELLYDRFLGAEEYVGDIIKKCAENMTWAEDSARHIFVVGNESAEQGPVSLRAALRAAGEKSITISTAYCAMGGSRPGISDVTNVRNWFGAHWGIKTRWIELARVSGGDYLQIVSEDGFVLPGTPPLLAAAWNGQAVARFADYIQSAAFAEEMQAMRLMKEMKGRPVGRIIGPPIEHSVMRHFAMYPRDATYLLRPQ